MKGFIPYAELNESQRAQVDSTDPSVRENAAWLGLGLDKLVNDKSWCVRWAVAARGVDEICDKLVSDRNSFVRRAVAEYGNTDQRDKLVSDRNPDVRQVVAICGTAKHRAKLIDDRNKNVRRWAERMMKLLDGPVPEKTGAPKKTHAIANVAKKLANVAHKPTPAELAETASARAKDINAARSREVKEPMQARGKLR